MDDPHDGCKARAKSAQGTSIATSQVLEIDAHEAVIPALGQVHRKAKDHASVEQGERRWESIGEKVTDETHGRTSTSSNWVRLVLWTEEANCSGINLEAAMAERMLE
ncbi:unnamed protein product [Aphanomyces euteiches]